MIFMTYLAPKTVSGQLPLANPLAQVQDVQNKFKKTVLCA